MTNKEKKIIGTILDISQDKKTHIMYRDCLSWIETKMAEIERLALMLPYIKVEKIDSKDPDIKDVWVEPKDGYMDIIKTEYIATLQKMEWELEDVVLDPKLGLDDGQREYLRQTISNMFNKILYDGEVLKLDKEQKECLAKVLKEITGVKI